MKAKGPTEHDEARWQRKQAIIDYYKGNLPEKPSLRKPWEIKHQSSKRIQKK